MRAWIAFAFFAPALAAAAESALDGYVFREADAGPPRRRLTLELTAQGRTRYRETTNREGGFTFEKVRDGDYHIRARYNEFIITEEVVTVAGPRRNFLALMLPKRHAGLQGFGTVSAGELAAQSNPKVRRLLRAGARCADRKDWEGAIATYERAVAAGAHAEVWEALGSIYQHLGKTERAVRAFENAIEKDPRYLPAYSHLASVYLEESRYTELAAVARRALSVDSEWMTGYAYLAEAQAGMHDLAPAQRSAERAVALAHERAAAPYLILTKILWHRRNCAGARNAMRRYLELNTSARLSPDIRKSLDMLEACNAG